MDIGFHRDDVTNSFDKIYSDILFSEEQVFKKYFLILFSSYWCIVNLADLNYHRTLRLVCTMVM